MPVEWNDISKNANGGTELMMRRLETLPSELLEKFQIIPSRVSTLDDTKIRIYWCHDLPYDPASEHLLKDGWKKFHKIVFVSHWQRQAYINRYNIPFSKTIVMQNAIEPITKEFSSTIPEKINIIYHTTPHRGLDILYTVFNNLVMKDEFKDKLHLDVYSSFKIYGWEERDKDFNVLYDKIREHDHMTYHGSVSNDEVRNALTKSHVFAYPSIWPETSCIALMEAISAGLFCVHPDFAALPETASNWTSMYSWDEDKKSHASTFYSMLEDTCKFLLNTSPIEYKTRLQAQKSYVDLFYSWELRQSQWKNFLESLQNESPIIKEEVVFEYRT